MERKGEAGGPLKNRNLESRKQKLSGRRKPEDRRQRTEVGGI
jgi:hypothetical protein